MSAKIVVQDTNCASTPVTDSSERTYHCVRFKDMSECSTEVGHGTPYLQTRKRRYSTGPPSNYKTTGAQRFLAGRKMAAGKSTSANRSRFLLGGNVRDPLNLASLNNEDVNRLLNAVTPKSSPMPTPAHRKEVVEVIIPPNIHDPLNLNAGEDGDTGATTSQHGETGSMKKRKNKKRNKRRRTISEGDDCLVAATESKSITGITANISQDVAIDVNKAVRACESVSAASSEQRISTDLDLTENLQSAVQSDTKALWKYKKKRKSGSTSLNKQDALPDGHQKVADTIVSPVVLVSKSAPGDSVSPKVKRRKHYSSSFSKQPSTVKSHGADGRKPATISVLPTLAKKDAFLHGNHARLVYGEDGDRRLRAFRKEWFRDKDVIDVGCNTGHVALHVAEHMQPRSVVGIDIDPRLVKVAQKNLRRKVTMRDPRIAAFPTSMMSTYGAIGVAYAAEKSAVRFPNNVTFREENYVLSCNLLLETQRPEVDTVIMLSITKWIHLNWGDDGLKRTFKRIYAQLRPGGHLIMEAQGWPSYAKSKNTSDKTRTNYSKIRMRPDQYSEYLLSNEVGFSTCELVDCPCNPAKGYKRPIYLFRKPLSTHHRSVSSAKCSKHDSSSSREASAHH
ncbi:PREDICTED: 7SK snRNA methylphosphate capping enzyme-like [Priapulus caudatus]|uniref:RNA methyltransferase n=1 Tax=Priapulus caudatus TaxID=37621 RepID=A0ABM1DSM1_PRICU|nr:PREDICTED: 7SK snRNA methylphosphate capping enzyme-like [Priapulus caudatus]